MQCSAGNSSSPAGHMATTSFEKRYEQSMSLSLSFRVSIFKYSCRVCALCRGWSRKKNFQNEMEINCFCAFLSSIFPYATVSRAVCRLSECINLLRISRWSLLCVSEWKVRAVRCKKKKTRNHTTIPSFLLALLFSFKHGWMVAAKANTYKKLDKNWIFENARSVEALSTARRYRNSRI